MRDSAIVSKDAIEFGEIVCGLHTIAGGRVVARGELIADELLYLSLRGEGYNLIDCDSDCDGINSDLHIGDSHARV